MSNLNVEPLNILRVLAIDSKVDFTESQIQKANEIKTSDGGSMVFFYVEDKKLFYSVFDSVGEEWDLRNNEPEVYEILPDGNVRDAFGKIYSKDTGEPLLDNDGWSWE